MKSLSNLWMVSKKSDQDSDRFSNLSGKSQRSVKSEKCEKPESSKHKENPIRKQADIQSIKSFQRRIEKQYQKKQFQWLPMDLNSTSSLGSIKSQKEKSQWQILKNQIQKDKNPSSVKSQKLLDDGLIAKPFQEGFFQGQKDLIGDQSDFERSVCSSESSIMTKRTINQHQISYKINITDNMKYQILQHELEDKNQPRRDFRKSKILDLKTSQSTQKPQKNNQLEVISIEGFFNGKHSWDELDKISRANPTNQTIFMIYREILNSVLCPEDKNNHDRIKANIVDESRKQPNSYFTILLAIENYLKDVNKQIEVIFCEKSTLKTQVSLKIISTGFAFHKFKCSQKISEEKFSTFQKIARDPIIYGAFQIWYRQQVQNNYKVPQENIRLTSIQKLENGYLGVEWDTYEPQLIYRSQKAKKRIKVSPYFKKFYISIEDFDTERGNIMFPTQQNKIYRRGNYPYYQPQNCSRFSIKVWDKFDSGNNEWLQMGNQPNEWCSAFFGLYHPTQSLSSAMFSDISFEETMAQQYTPVRKLKNILKNTKSYNTKEMVGQGILCTLYMWNALQDAHLVQVNGEKFALVFQCRVNPEKMKITRQDEYWMVNQFCDIRPYGIILVKESVKKSYPKPQLRFASLFKYHQQEQQTQKQERQTKSTV